MDIGEMECEDIDWIQLTQRRVQCQAAVNMLIHFLLPYKAEIS